MQSHKMIISLFVFLLAWQIGQAGTRRVPGNITGKYYNDLSKDWSNEPVIVYVDSRGNAYIKAGSDPFAVRGLLYSAEIPQFIEALNKGIQWAQTAKQDGMEITKNLESFMKGNKDEFSEHGIKLTFFAAKSGTQTSIIFSITDFENNFMQLDYYLGTVEVKQLIKLLEKAPSVSELLQKQESKLDGR